MICQNILAECNNRGAQSVNIAIWNMHLKVDEHFEGIVKSGLSTMGNGGGFRVVLFLGSGYLKNHGESGLENLLCHGNQTQSGNVITFQAIPAAQNGWDGRYRVYWATGNSADIFVRNHKFSSFGLEYTLLCDGNGASFIWHDGTKQYVKTVHGNVITWAVVGHADITWVKY